MSSKPCLERCNLKMRCRICSEGCLARVGTLQSPYTSQEYTLYQCESCRSRSFDVNENIETDLSEYYESRSERQICNGFHLSKYWLHEVGLIKQIYCDIPKSVLDIGCCTGDFLLHWSDEIIRCGVELSSKSADIARNRGLEVKQGFVEEVEFSCKFDVVTAYAVLEHLAEPGILLNKLVELVNEAGVLVIMIPSYQTLKARILELLHIRWHMYSPPEHLSLYSREFLEQYLTAKGFLLVRRRYTSGGMFNPLKPIPLVGRGFGQLMWLLDTYSFLNRLPIFDHMYSYYIKAL